MTDKNEEKKTFQDMIAEFYKAIKYPIEEGPQMLDEAHFARRVAWLKEEITELEDSDTLYDQVDALVDLIYFAIGFFVAMGVPLEPMFKIVHEANMRKVVGVLEFYPDGKIVKPVNWLPPESEIAMTIDIILMAMKKRKEDERE